MKIKSDEHNNQIIGNLILKNSSISFTGENNIFYVNGTVLLDNSMIRFTGSNSVVYFEESIYPYPYDVRVGNDSVMYLGRNSYVNRLCHFFATERKNIIIGNEFMSSFEIYYRTSDSHLIYDINNKKRVNDSKSILIGDDVFIGQQSLILKNTIIGSGAIIGAHSVVSSKVIPSNTLYAGNPVKKIKRGVFCPGPDPIHDYTLEEEVDSEYASDALVDKYSFSNDQHTISLSTIDQDLMNINSSKDKLKYIIEHISNYQYKNRFYLN